MKILLNNDDLNKALNNVKDLGFVPTMGSLHEGHISLIRESQKRCKKTLVTIYINPKQFNNKKDFKSYPKKMNADLTQPEIIKRYHIINEPFTIENNLMTPTIKVRRHEVEKKYSEVINGMF